MKCKVCVYGEIYDEMLFSNHKFPMTADAAEYFRAKSIERGIEGSDLNLIDLLLKILNRGCVRCREDGSSDNNT